MRAHKLEQFRKNVATQGTAASVGSHGNSQGRNEVSVAVPLPDIDSTTIPVCGRVAPSLPSVQRGGGGQSTAVGVAVEITEPEENPFYGNRHLANNRAYKA